MAAAADDRDTRTGPAGEGPGRGASPEQGGDGERSSAAALQEAVREAIDRTLTATLGSAGISRERAQTLVDDILRRSEEQASQARGRVRETAEASAEAAAAAAARLRDAVADLRLVTGEDLRRLREGVDALAERVAALERGNERQGKKNKKKKQK